MKTEGISLPLAASPADAIVLQPGGTCDPHTLAPGGRILCADALEMAPLMGIPSKDLGKLLDHLEIKVRSCSLGCF